MRKVDSDAVESDKKFVANNAELIVQGGAMLDTHVGRFLQKRGWMNKSITVVSSLSVVCACLQFIFDHEHHEVVDHGGVIKRAPRAHFIALSFYSLWYICLFLVSHKMNRQLFFKCVKSFDSLMIIAAYMTWNATSVINWYIVFFQAGAWEWIHLFVGFPGVGHIPLYIGTAAFISAVDSLTVRRCTKLCVCLAIWLIGFSNWCQTRVGMFDDFWSDEPITWWLVSMPPQQIYMTSLMQVLLFIGKATFAYGSGEDFAFIICRYRNPDHQLLADNVLGKGSMAANLDIGEDGDVEQLHGAGASIPELFMNSTDNSQQLANDLANSHLELLAPTRTREFGAEVEQALPKEAKIGRTRTRFLFTNTGQPETSAVGAAECIEKHEGTLSEPVSASNVSSSAVASSPNAPSPEVIGFPLAVDLRSI